MTVSAGRDRLRIGTRGLGPGGTDSDGHGHGNLTGQSGCGVGVSLVERLLLQKRRGECLELIAVLADQLDHMAVSPVDELAYLRVDELLRGF